MTNPMTPDLDELEKLYQEATLVALDKRYDDNAQICISNEDGAWIALFPHQGVSSIEAQQEKNVDCFIAVLNAFPALLALARKGQQAEEFFKLYEKQLETDAKGE